MRLINRSTQLKIYKKNTRNSRIMKTEKVVREKKMFFSIVHVLESFAIKFIIRKEAIHQKIIKTCTCNTPTIRNMRNKKKENK